MNLIYFLFKKSFSLTYFWCFINNLPLKIDLQPTAPEKHRRPIMKHPLSSSHPSPHSVLAQTSRKPGWHEESISVFLKMFSFLMVLIFILLPILSCPTTVCSLEWGALSIN